MIIGDFPNDEDWIIDDEEIDPFEKSNKNRVLIEYIITTLRIIHNGTLTKKDAYEIMLRNDIDKEDFEKYSEVFRAGRLFEMNRILETLQSIKDII